MNKTTAILTAKWWRNKLECNHHNNGDSSCDIAGILADYWLQKINRNKWNWKYLS